MKSDLQALVDQWQTGSYIREARVVHVVRDPQVPTELILAITAEVDVLVGCHAEKVRCYRRLPTRENGNLEMTSKNDCYNFYSTCAELDVEFFKQYEDTVAKLHAQQILDGGQQVEHS